MVNRSKGRSTLAEPAADVSSAVKYESFWKDYRDCRDYFKCLLAPQTSDNIA